MTEEPSIEVRYAFVCEQLAIALADLEKTERDLEDEVAARKGAERWADRIAAAFVPAEVLGEWSNSNAPWANALSYAEGLRRQRDRTTATVPTDESEGT